MRRNIAAGAGRWSAAHWKTATFGWVAVIALATALGAVAGTKMLSNAEQSSGEAARAERMLAKAHFAAPAGEAVLVSTGSPTVDAAPFRRAIAAVVAALRKRPEVTHLRSPLDGRHPGQISSDRRSALVEFDMRGDAATAANRVQPVLRAVDSAARAQPRFAIEELGAASAERELDQTTGKDFKRAERLSVPVTFAILLLAFGAFVAASVPVLLALSAVLGSVGLAALISHVQHASDATSSVILLIGMAVGVDYSLFYLKRERDERRRGLDGRNALDRAAATSGQAVLVSGATVMAAMAGMLFAGSSVFTSIGVGAIVVVLVSLVASLTVLPALLGKLGDRVDRGLLAVVAAALARALPRQPRVLVRLRERRTFLQRVKSEGGESRVWGAILRPALRYPAAAAAASTAVLVVLALPALGMHTRMPGIADLPKSLHVVRAYDRIQRAFPGTAAPAEVVVSGRDVTSPEIRRSIASLRRRALATGVLHDPIETRVNPAHTLAHVSVPLAGDGDDERSQAALAVLRGRVLPVTLGRVAGLAYAVTGETAGNHDFTHVAKARLPVVFAVVLGLAFVLLLVAFRSVVVPLKAIVLNLLSVGAAYGALVWVFQDGHGEGLLGFRSNGAIVTWVPVFLFTVLFGLSMDYHVFIVSRIRELVDRGFSTEEAVSRGIRTTAGTVTSAAAVMVAVFAIFASLSRLDLKQMGVGLAVAVLLDATIVRGVLLPATMRLLGDWNWYLPSWLRWLPRVRLERAPGVAAAEAQ